MTINHDKMLKIVCAVALFFSLARAVHAADLPLYCKALTKFERTCVGVKAAAYALGKGRALWLAQHCGASEFEIQQARDCLIPAPQACPAEWKCNGSRETNDPNCYAPACNH